MALQPVAVLGLDGWVNTPKEKMDNLFMHFVESNYSQSTLSRGQVYSFQYILNNGRNNANKLKEELQSSLVKYYSSYYASVSCEISVVKDPNKGDALILRIYLSVKDENGKEYNLAKESSDTNSKIIRWVNLNNYGDENRFTQ